MPVRWKCTACRTRLRASCSAWAAGWPTLAPWSPSSPPPPLLAVKAGGEGQAGCAICAVCASERTAGSAMGMALTVAAVRAPAAHASAARASAATARSSAAPARSSAAAAASFSCSFSSCSARTRSRSASTSQAGSKRGALLARSSMDTGWATCGRRRGGERHDHGVKWKGAASRAFAVAAEWHAACDVRKRLARHHISPTPPRSTRPHCHEACEATSTARTLR